MRGIAPLKNAKHEAFAQYKANGETDAKAYILAGYAPGAAHRSAPRLYKDDPEITPRIQYLLSQKAEAHEAERQKLIEKVGIDKQWVMERLVLVYDKAIEGEPVRRTNGLPLTDEQGNVIRRDPNLPAATKALELIGKEIGMFVTTVKTDEADPLLALLRRVSGGSLPVVHDVTDADDDDDDE